MKGRTPFLAVITALAFALFTTPGVAFDEVDRRVAAQIEESPAEIGLLIDRLEAHAAVQGATIEDIEISRNIRARGEAGVHAGTMSASCTATATVGIPGGTKVELSATAPTCAQAVQMLQAAIEELFALLPR